MPTAIESIITNILNSPGESRQSSLTGGAASITPSIPMYRTQMPTAAIMESEKRFGTPFLISEPTMPRISTTAKFTIVPRK